MIKSKSRVLVFGVLVIASHLGNGLGDEFRSLATLLAVFLGFLSTLSTHTSKYALQH